LDMCTGGGREGRRRRRRGRGGGDTLVCSITIKYMIAGSRIKYKLTNNVEIRLRIKKQNPF
jgi:hypothetical protein